MFDFELPEKFRRYVPVAVWLIVALALLAIPLKIVSYGFLPGDDALRHCAKAVSGKPWPEILVVGDNYKMDHHLGWHTMLGAIQGATNWDAETLLVFSITALFLLVNLATLPWLKRPEAWLAALLTAMIVSDVPQRFMLGRPFVITITALMTILFVAQKRRPNLKYFLLFTALITAAAALHGVWYLWLLPLAAFLFAGQFRWALVLAGAWLAGVVAAAWLTGHPADYLSQAFQTSLQATGKAASGRTLVTELRPFGGDILAVIAVGALVLLRRATKLNAAPITKNPAFWIVCGCWILGFRVSRFWEDWGWPALLVWIATEMDFLFAAGLAVDSLRRLWLALILAGATFLATTSDFNSRWTQCLTWEFLTPETPELAGWMPEKNGILYASDMTVFYQTFFKNPHGNWRYQLGYEPSMMPAEDFATYQKIIWNYGDARSYEPWVKKMKPADRLVIRGGKGERPNIPQLEWNYGVSGTWIGRTPRTSAP